MNTKTEATNEQPLSPDQIRSRIIRDSWNETLIDEQLEHEDSIEERVTIERKNGKSIKQIINESSVLSSDANPRDGSDRIGSIVG